MPDSSAAEAAWAGTGTGADIRADMLLSSRSAAAADQRLLASTEVQPCDQMSQVTAANTWRGTRSMTQCAGCVIQRSEGAEGWEYCLDEGVEDWRHSGQVRDVRMGHAAVAARQA